MQAGLAGLLEDSLHRQKAAAAALRSMVIRNGFESIIAADRRAAQHELLDQAHNSR
jgi:hypothetical protein